MFINLKFAAEQYKLVVLACQESDMDYLKKYHDQLLVQIASDWTSIVRILQNWTLISQELLKKLAGVDSSNEDKAKNLLKEIEEKLEDAGNFFTFIGVLTSTGNKELVAIAESMGNDYWLGQSRSESQLPVHFGVEVSLFSPGSDNDPIPQDRPTLQPATEEKRPAIFLGAIGSDVCHNPDEVFMDEFSSDQDPPIDAGPHGGNIILPDIKPLSTSDIIDNIVSKQGLVEPLIRPSENRA